MFKFVSVLFNVRLFPFVACLSFPSFLRISSTLYPLYPRLNYRLYLLAPMTLRCLDYISALKWKRNWTSIAFRSSAKLKETFSLNPEMFLAQYRVF